MILIENRSEADNAKYDEYDLA